MSTTADDIPQCAFCERKASYVWHSTDTEYEGVPLNVGRTRLHIVTHTCLSPKCVKQAKGMVLVGETDE